MTVQPLHVARRFSPRVTVVGILATAVALAMLLPAVYLVLRVSGDWGLAWETMSSARAMDALQRTIILAATVSLGTIAIAVPIAWLTTRTDLPFARVWFVLLALPLAIPSYVSALTLVLFLGPRGILQGWLEPLGVDRLPEIYGFWGAWLALTLFTYPYVLLPVRSALLSLDRSFEEAARSLGRAPLATFFRVVLPQLRPSIVAGALLVALYTLSDFGAVSLMDFGSLSRQVYVQYNGTFDREAAASLGLLLVFVAVAVVTLEALTRSRARYHSISQPRQPRKTPLGRWKWVALGYLSAIFLVSLAIPLGVLLHRVGVGLSHGESLQALGEPARNSAWAALLAAGATVVVALPIAYMASRRPGPYSSALERLSYSGYALPGIVIGLSLVHFASQYAPWLYFTLPLLIFAFVVRFLPEALGPARASFLRINPRTEEAGRSLGRSSVYVFLRVTLPQLVPGLSAAGALVFLTAMKELPVTLMLSPIGFDTLAVQVWSLSSEAFFTRASYAATVLVFLSAIPVLVMAARERSPV